MARATFGDFLQAAHASIGQRSGASGPAARGSVEEVSASMLRVVTVMGRYLQDMTAGLTGVPARTRPALDPWAIACLQAREALSNSAGSLTERPPRTLEAALALAAEHYVFSDESQFVAHDVREIASALVGAPIWRFWWD